jgi:hypothetical protein
MLPPSCCCTLPPRRELRPALLRMLRGIDCRCDPDSYGPLWMTNSSDSSSGLGYKDPNTSLVYSLLRLVVPLFGRLDDEVRGVLGSRLEPCSRNAGHVRGEALHLLSAHYELQLGQRGAALGRRLFEAHGPAVVANMQVGGAEGRCGWAGKAGGGSACR